MSSGVTYTNLWFASIGVQINNLTTVSDDLEKRRLYQVCRVPSWTLSQTEYLVLAARCAVALDGLSPRTYRGVLIL